MLARASARALRPAAQAPRRGFFGGMYRAPNNILKEAEQINDPHNHNLMHYKRGGADMMINYAIYGLTIFGGAMAVRGIYYEMANGYGKKPI